MTERRALVLIDGKQSELPVGDTLAGVGGGSGPNLAYVPLAVVADRITPDLADGENFVVTLGADVYPRLELPLNASEGARFAVTFDVGGDFSGYFRFGLGYEWAQNADYVTLEPWARTRIAFEIDDRGKAVMLEIQPSLAPAMMIPATARYVCLWAFPADGGNDDVEALFKEVKFGTASGPIPPNMTANTDGSYSIWNQSSFAVLDQVGDVYHASDGNSATAFGAYSADLGAYSLVFDLGESKALTSAVVTLAASGLWQISVTVSDDGLEYAPQTVGTPLQGVFEITADEPFTVLP